MEVKKGLELDRIIFIGRTFEEYCSMFHITPEEIASLRILDCPGGACSFTATANSQGGRVVSADIAYAYPSQELYEKGKRDIDHAIDQMSKVKDRYVWSYFSDLQELSVHRNEALELCTHDMIEHPNCYVETELPSLPFTDQQFDLVLSAHFLFMYSDRLSQAFHLATLTELMRVARQEIRIYPITQLDGDRSFLVETIINYAKQMGWKSEIIPISYEFQRGAVHMLSLTNANE
ncbi:SAM-dependent methyltransferase [Paenibacillus sp. Marseille-Q4541]|uniref:SAM-dependent methyltransferase n=1 Tax=Paenibacillus sp. Marseille-Q4541 TaxID=2831522 RepID=UPI001BA9C317|nr:SAM-dependent methyltransferase [Paenibacillus sp. Marseille-Q4541]